MKITITGSLGNISKPLAQKLTAFGHQVTIISSNADKTAAIEALGATAAIGSLEDADFLTKSFTGADAVYTMVPPNFTTNDWKKFITGIGHKYAEAIKASGVKNVVNLSSIGGHLSAGAGPISFMHFVENELNAIADVNILTLRPAYFYTNLYNNVDLIKHAGIIGGNYSADKLQVLVHPTDIAETAADALNELSFKGKSYIYIVSSEHTGNEVASILGAAIDKPNLPWVEFKDEDVVNALLQNGASAEVAKYYTEMGNAINSGILLEDYTTNKNVVKGKISLEEFAKEFAKAF